MSFGQQTQQGNKSVQNDVRRMDDGNNIGIRENIPQSLGLRENNNNKNDIMMSDFSAVHNGGSSNRSIYSGMNAYNQPGAHYLTSGVSNLSQSEYNKEFLINPPLPHPQQFEPFGNIDGGFANHLVGTTATGNSIYTDNQSPLPFNASAGYNGLNSLNHEQNVFEKSFINSGSVNRAHGQDGHPAAAHQHIRHNHHHHHRNNTTNNFYDYGNTSLVHSSDGSDRSTGGSGPLIRFNDHFGKAVVGQAGGSYYAVNDQTGQVSVIPSITVHVDNPNQAPLSNHQVPQHLSLSAGGHSSTLDYNAPLHHAIPETGNAFTLQNLQQQSFTNGFLQQTNTMPPISQQRRDMRKEESNFQLNPMQMPYQSYGQHPYQKPSDNGSREQIGGLSRKHIFEKKSSGYREFEQAFMKEREEIEKAEIEEQGLDKKKLSALEKNRIAAHRCRERKKAWIKRLEGKLQDTERQHKDLVSEQDTLRQELVALNRLLGTNECLQ
ncbi:hypothetical protein MP228_010089 [Amoeboaphelidium protococcarum]|nr:hypothetical protein MP228_010089 [Amoeboaphelidium protococcarum]